MTVMWESTVRKTQGQNCAIKWRPETKDNAQRHVSRKTARYEEKDSPMEENRQQDMKGTCSKERTGREAEDRINTRWRC